MVWFANPFRLKPYTQMIEIENINKFYGKLHVLRDLTLSIGKGEIVSIVGPSGAGKSCRGFATAISDSCFSFISCSPNSPRLKTLPYRL